MDNCQEIRNKINKMYGILCVILAVFFVIGIFAEYKLYTGNVCMGHELGRFTLLFIVGNWIAFNFLAFIETVRHSSDYCGYVIALILEMLVNIGLYIFLYIHVFTTKTVLNFILPLIIFLIVSILQVVIAVLYYIGVGQKQNIYEHSVDAKNERDKAIKKVGEYNSAAEKYNLMNERIEAIAEKIGKLYKYTEEKKQEVQNVPVYDISNIHLLCCKGKPTREYINKVEKYKDKYQSQCEWCDDMILRVDNVMKKKMGLLEQAERTSEKIGAFNSDKLDEIFKNTVMPAFEYLEKKTRDEKKIRRSRKKYGK